MVSSRFHRSFLSPSARKTCDSTIGNTIFQNNWFNDIGAFLMCMLYLHSKTCPIGVDPPIGRSTGERVKGLAITGQFMC